MHALLVFQIIKKAFGSQGRTTFETRNDVLFSEK